jgi:peptidyl-prolyl cis-trans isomerase B (cyclophilin B)
MAVRTAIALIVLMMFFAVAGIGQQPSPAPTPEKREPVKANPRPSPTPPPFVEPFEKADVRSMASKCVMLETEAGNIEIELYPESAPESVRNFLDLVAIGALDTTTFSRVVPGFVIQGGNIATREIPDEPNKILHERGIVSMARSSEPDSATTHFFILVDSAPSLDGTFAAFGRVTKGMDVVDAINKAPVEGEKPVKPVKIKKAIVTACSAAPRP